MSTTVLQNGVYYITNQYTATVLTLLSDVEGANLTAWAREDSPGQQWNVTGVSDLYTFRNVANGNYISFDGRSPGSLNQFWARSQPFPFYLQPYKGGYLIGCSNTGYEREVMNLEGGYLRNDTHVILWPLTVQPGADNSVWYFNSTTPSPPAPPGASNSTVVSAPTRSLRGRPGPIAGGVVGGLVVVIALLILAFFVGRRNRPSTSPPVDSDALAYLITPMVLGPETPGIMPPGPPPETQGPVMFPQHEPYMERRDAGMIGGMVGAGSAGFSGSPPTIFTSSKRTPVASTAGSSATGVTVPPASPPPMYR